MRWTPQAEIMLRDLDLSDTQILSALAGIGVHVSLDALRKKRQRIGIRKTPEQIAALRDAYNSPRCKLCKRFIRTGRLCHPSCYVPKVFRVTDGIKFFSCESHYDHFVLTPEDGSPVFKIIELSLYGLRKCRK